MARSALAQRPPTLRRQHLIGGCGTARSARPDAERGSCLANSASARPASDQPAGQAREINKLASLSAEGRSSATTLLVSSALRWMNTQRQCVAAAQPQAARLHRQSPGRRAAGGPFQRLPLRRPACARRLSRRCARPDPSGLSEDEFGRRVQASAWVSPLPIASGARSGCSTPRSKVSARSKPSARWPVLAYRVWVDQRRGWRFTNPNLEELGLVRAEYVSLDDLAADDDAFANAPPELRAASTRDATRSACRFCWITCGMAWPSRPMRSIPRRVEAIGKRIAAEPARPLGNIAAGGAARCRRADHRCSEDAPRRACAASR